MGHQHSTSEAAVRKFAYAVTGAVLAFGLVVISYSQVWKIPLVAEAWHTFWMGVAVIGFAVLGFVVLLWPTRSSDHRPHGQGREAPTAYV